MSWFNGKKTGSVIIYLLIIFVAKAQPGCPAINAGPDVSLPCGTSCTTLRATPFNAGATTTYGVNTIPYTPFSYTAGTSVLVNQDDIWGDVIDLPFNFCFYGNVYNQAVIGANGIITFNTSVANTTNEWDITGSNPIPDNTAADAFFTNCIMFPYQDIDPELGGSIHYQIIGTAPCRMFIVSYNNVPMYDSDDFFSDCFGTNNTTCQVVLYETTNVIEMYIKKKEACTDWNDGLAIEGIMDATGTNAAWVPGRNLTVWDATNDAWRFTPNGTSIVAVSWYNGATQISTDSFVTVCPTAATTYTAKAVYTPCAGGTPVTVTDQVVVSPPGTLDVGIDSVINVSCAGPNSGAAYAHVTGGNPPISYGWSTSPNALSITNVTAGTYIFTATDAAGCVRRDTAVITSPPPVAVTVPNESQISCVAGTGSLTAQPTGGNPPYTYSWPGGQTGISDTAIAAGTYTVTVTDASGCTATGSGTLTVTIGGNTVVLNAPTLKNVSCFGAADGSIIAHASGGSAPYHYTWSAMQNTDTAHNLNPGTYGVIVSDAGSCTAAATYNITGPAQLAITANVQNIGCGGALVGSIAATATGGTPALTYTWTKQSNNTSLTGATITNLHADTYILTVTDANHCRDSATYQVTQTPPLIFTVDTTNVTCNGGNNGSLAVHITSGTAPYYFGWDNNDPIAGDSTLNNLMAGEVDLILSDSNNCTISTVYNITQPNPLVIQLVNQTNVLCFGNNTGKLTVVASGDTPGYNYVWSNAETGPTDTALIANTYTVVVTDTNSCTATQSYTITQPTLLTINPADIQNIGCAGGNTGSLTANAIQGTPPYSYIWLQQSNNQIYTGQTINNLAPDTYTLGVTDANGCVDTALYTITAIPLLQVSVSTVNVSCFNGNNGSALASVTSGTAPFQYSFNNGDFGYDSTYINATAGALVVTVRDTNSCTFLDTVNITQPTPIVITLDSQTNVTCNGGNNGQLTISVSGGTPAYTLNWNNQITGLQNNNIAAGDYVVVVIDNNDCLDTARYTITQPTAITVNPVVINALCYGGANGSINANPSGGTPGYTFVWDNGQTTQINSTLAQGTYAGTVTDVRGCTAYITDTVGQPNKMIITDLATAVKCIGQKSGTITVSATGDTPPYAYYATNDNVNFVAATNSVILGLDTGVYTVLVTDTFGCTNTDSAYIPPAIPDDFLTATDSTLCYGPNYNDGAAHILATTVINGPYQFGIDNGILQDTGYFQNLSAGLHIITAVNANSCVDSIPVVVFEPLPVIAIVTPDSLLLPLGGSQQVLVTYLNATNPIYNWGDNILGLSCTDCPNPVVSAYAPGNYVVEVSMVNGTATCFATTILHVAILDHTRAFIPNAFTPNGDGNNDVFQVYGEDIQTLDMKIFNRWGEVVYSTTNSLAGWDGTYRGNLQMPGVYTYETVITYLDNTQEKKNGTITLIR